MSQLSSESEVSVALLFNSLQSSANKNCLKNTSVVRVASVKKMDDFHYAKEATIN